MNKNSREKSNKFDTEAHLRAVINTAIEGIITIDKKGIIQTINPAAEKIFSYDEEEVKGKNISMLMPKPYEEEHDTYIKNYLSTGKAKIIGIGREVKGKRKNGIVFPMWLQVAQYFENGQRFFVGFIKDLSTERNYLDRVIGYERILEDSINEVYLFDAETLLFTHANQGALKNLQYSDEEIKKLTPLDLKPEYTLESFQKLIKPLKSGNEEKIQFTTVHRRKDGSLYPVEVHLELIDFESRKVFVAIILDISEKISAETNIKAQQEQLMHMDRVSIMGEMAAGIAHEINQPLTAINSYANAAARRIKSGNIDIDSIGKLLEKISNASIRASDVISHLRIMLKPNTKQHRHLNINSLIEDAVELANSDSRAREFELILGLAKDLPKVTADGVQIQQVIINLIRNAMDESIDKSDESKEIEITTRLLPNENRIEVSIKDQGKGIDPKKAEKLFDPFFTTKGMGMGMGLTICQTIIHNHHGKLWFTQNPDKGATFHFTIPTALDIDNE